MKTIATLLFFSFLCINSFSQGIVLLPSAGIQSTATTIEGDSPFLKNGKQYKSVPNFSIRAFNNQRSGFFVGFSTANIGFAVTPNDRPKYDNLGNFVITSRLEAGYQWTSKQLFLTGNKKDGKNTNGLFVQFQPLLGIGYNFEPRSSYGGHSVSGSYQLTTFNNIHGNISLLAGGNIYLGTKNKPFLFFSVMNNFNFAGDTQRGVLTTTQDNTTYTQRLQTRGSGMTWSIGVPIRIGNRKNK